MIAFLRSCSAALAALVAVGTAEADEAEIMARYGAYDAAFSAGRFAEAEVEAEAAWRAAEGEWGASRAETAVLAFNLVRTRLLLEQRSAAVEPALRVLELVDAGAAGAAISRPDALFLTALAQFDAESPDREEIAALEEALGAFAPADGVGQRLGWTGWSYVAQAQFDLEQWRRTYEAAEQATRLMEEEGSATPSTIATVALYGIVAAYEIEQFGDALVLANRGIAAFPPQPKEQPIDATLGRLIGWDEGLRNFIYQRGEDDQLADQDDGARWQEGRYPEAMGCGVTWLERTPPEYPIQALRRGAVLAMMFEVYLDADGAVLRVDPVGAVQNDMGFADSIVTALQGWRAEPQPRAECRGPWSLVIGFQLSR